MLAGSCHTLDGAALIDGAGVQTPVGFHVGITWHLCVTDRPGGQDAVVCITELDEHFPVENIEMAVQKTDAEAAECIVLGKNSLEFIEERLIPLGIEPLHVVNIGQMAVLWSELGGCHGGRMSWMVCIALNFFTINTKLVCKFGLTVPRKVMTACFANRSVAVTDISSTVTGVAGAIAPNNWTTIQCVERE